jgi:adenine deaminase
LKENQLISVARGDSPADLVLKNARIVNVFNGEIETGNVAVYAGKIAGIGDYSQAGQVIDLEGRYLAPGLIDGHVHLESSMLDVAQYARAVVPRGTTAIVTDLHEIANVAGLDGMRYVMNAARRLPFDLFMMAPSCVPATHLETSGASLDAAALRRVLGWNGCIGLGEVMNYPGVIGADDAMLEKIGLFLNKVADGHAPGVSGKNLNAYIASGIYSDHESVSADEAGEKLSRGMYVMIREGSSEKNLEALLPIVTDKTYKRCLFVIDDRSCVDLLNDGDIDAVVRKAVSLGMDPVRAIQLATINTAEYFRLARLGGIAPGYLANLMVLEDLPAMKADLVFYRGWLVASGGDPMFQPYRSTGKALTGSVRIKPFGIDALKLAAKGDTAPVIRIIPGQIVTGKSVVKVKKQNGAVMPDVSRDILKLAVVERHNATGNIGLGLVTGFGLKEGALASSIAHDSHNIVAVGTSDEDIYKAVKEIEKMQGGLVAVSNSKVLASLPLPIAGLLSDEPLETVVGSLARLEKVAARLGTKLPSPFSTLSFVALPVIPELRLTDLGLVDVLEFKLLD